MVDAIKIAKVKYSSEHHKVFWLFDHSSGHTAFADDALNVNRMDVKPGGKQPKMHDTIYNGKRFSMVITKEGPTKGQPKGMKLVLEDRRKRTDGLKADDMALEKAVKNYKSHRKIYEEDGLT